MADFCNQCARSLGLPEGDFDDTGNKNPPPEGMGFMAICEGCGPTVVDLEGNCICKECNEHIKEGE